MISTDLGAIILRGDGTDSSVMEEAGMARVGFGDCCAGDDEDNLMICQMAKKKFDVKRTIARASIIRRRAYFQTIGIDNTVSVTDLISRAD